MLNEPTESLFKSLLTEHSGAVLKVARAYTLTTEDCQDLVQKFAVLRCGTNGHVEIRRLLAEALNHRAKLNRLGARTEDKQDFAATHGASVSTSRTIGA